MIISKLLNILQSSKINLKIIEDRIDVEAPKGALTKDIIELIKDNKKMILDYFYTNNLNRYNSIKPARIRDYYPLSSAQKRLYILQQMDLSSTTYNIAQIVPIENIPKNQLEVAVKELISRHESLRTFFEIINDEPIQKIHDEVPLEIKYYEVKNSSENDNIFKQFVKPFNLNEVPLLRVGLIKTADNNCYLLIDMHHIISDGTSIELLRKDFKMLLNNEKLEPLRLQYKDYSEWQNSEEQKEIIKKQEEYWIKTYSNEIPLLNLPYDYTRPTYQNFEGATVNFTLNKNITRKIKKLCKGTNSTLSITLLAIYNILLSKLSGQEDIIVGLPIAGRKHSDLENIIGMFVNTLAMRNYPKAELRFKDFLNDVKNNTLLAYENQEYQFEDLVEKIGVTRDFSRNPIFDVCFNMLNMGSFNDNTYKVEETYEHTSSLAKFDITLTAFETSDTININLEYATKLFNPNTINRFIEYFKKLIEEITFEIKLSEIEIITETEKELVLYEFNDTIVNYPNDKTIHQLFEEQVERTPDNTVLVFENKEMSFRELNEKSNQLARVLRNKGVVPDSIVGLMVDWSFEMIMGIMGILKASGAYLPIDNEYPEKRKLFMLENSNAQILLTKNNIYKEFGYIGDVILLDDIKLHSLQSDNLPLINKSNDIAYVIYTSGTTDTPKGVMIEHTSAINTLLYLNKLYPLEQNDSYLLKTSYCFDVSVSEIFCYLFNGARLVILKPGFEKDLDQLLLTIKENKITHINFVPSMFNMIAQSIDSIDINSFKSLKYIFLAGEAFLKSMALPFKEYCDFIKLENLYGPTEATIYASGYSLQNLDTISNIPIGKPINNTDLYIINNFFLIQPIGVAGELLIGGTGLARGYLNRDDLTREKFIYWEPETGKTYNKDCKTESAIRVYRTGDLCRWLPDGNIEFLGRIDHQVKIRGFRIELGEIENQLLNIENIKETIVLAKEDHSGQKYLIAYIVSETEIEISELRGTLLKFLPDYMIPAHFVILNKLPLNSNGKIDRKLLPDPEIKVKEYIAPRNEIEEILVEIWAEVLNIKKGKISIDSNFFELGGDSIKTIQIASRLNRHGIKLSVTDIFKHPRIEQLSTILKQSDKPISQDLVTGEIALTPIQVWFLNSGFTDIHHFNHSIMLCKRDRFDLTIIDKVFNELTTHHDLLRTTFEKNSNGYIQYNNGLDKNYYTIESHNLIGKKNYAKLIEEKSTNIQKSINLATGPLLKIGHFITDNEDHLLIVIHHLLIDGISWRILFEDFSFAYNAVLNKNNIVFPPKTNSFKYWSEKLKEYANSPKLLKEQPYWEKAARDFVPPLPKDNKISREQKINQNQRNIIVSFSEFETENILKNSCKTYNTEINDILLSALVHSVCKWGNIESIMVELEGHGREQIIEDININRTIGWFTTQYPAILKYYEDISTLIKETKENLRQIPNKGIGYGILKYLREDKSLKAEPEICFNYLGEFTGNGINSFEDDLLYEFSNLSNGESIGPFMESNYTLNINGMTANKILSFTFGYNMYEYTEETIEKLTVLFKKNLLELSEHCIAKIEKEATPSDYGLKNVSLNDLNKLKSKIKLLN